jgi:hypothetical protein
VSSVGEPVLSLVINHKLHHLHWNIFSTKLLVLHSTTDVRPKKCPTWPFLSDKWLQMIKLAIVMFLLRTICMCVCEDTYKGWQRPLRYSSKTPTFYQNDFAMRNTADVTGGQPIAVWLQSISGGDAVNPLVAFYDIHGRKREALLSCPGHHTRQCVCEDEDIQNAIKTLPEDRSDVKI